MKEIWKDIPGYEGIYQISNHGTARSLDRLVTGGGKNNSTRCWLCRGRVLTPGVDGPGYKFINVSLNGRTRMFRIHRLVAQLFITNPNGFLEVNHLDGDRSNNHYSNLEWSSAHMNRVHATRQLQKGNVKLTVEQVINIRVQLTTGRSHRSLAEEYGVTKPTITQISTGRNWKHLNQEVI